MKDLKDLNLLDRFLFFLYNHTLQNHSLKVKFYRSKNYPIKLQNPLWSFTFPAYIMMSDA